MQRQDSRWEAFWAYQGLVRRHARLAKRESVVVAAVAEVDIDGELLVADELRRFVTARIAAERDAWERGEPASIEELFGGSFGSPAGRYRIACRDDPLASLVWASRRSDGEPWQLVLCVSVQISVKASSWRVARSDLGFSSWQILSAWWTLEREGDAWKIAGVESPARGHHYLQDPLPNAPVDGDLHDDATISLAVGDRAPAAPVAELTEVDAPVRRRLLDLSGVEDRFAPDVIAACVREIARAWESATEQADSGELARWSTPEAVAQLCHPTPNGIRRVRNLELRRVKIDALDTEREPPSVAITAHLHGLRWLANRPGAHAPISGNELHPRSFTEHWTLRFEPGGDAPWRVADVRGPGRR